LIRRWISFVDDDCAAALKCPTIYFVAQVTTAYADGSGVCCACRSPTTCGSLRPLKGVRVAVEHIGRSIVHTLADAVDLAREADIGICVELYTVGWSAIWIGYLRKTQKRFAIVQLSDSKTGELTFRNRLVPGDGDIPLEWLLERL